jgi:pyruvate dehydrogenase E2 component (dihydrolipoamide acetyltransferase)
MAKVLEMPKLSPTMEEGVLSAWHKKEGDAIAVDDLLAEVETDKATMEFRAFDKGTLLKLLVPAGSQVKLGQPVAIVGEKGEDVSGLAASAGGGEAARAPEKKNEEEGRPQEAKAEQAPRQAERAAKAGEDGATSAPATGEAAGTPTRRERPVETMAPPGQRRPNVGNVLDRTSYPAEAAPPGNGRQAEGGRVMASPYVRKAAREMGIDLHGAQGSGPGGRVLPQDLEALRGTGAALARMAPAPGPVAKAPGQPGQPGQLALAAPEARPLSPMRKTIARRLTESKSTVPHFYLSIDVDAGALVALREQINAELASPGNGRSDGQAPALKVSINDLLVKACAVGLVRVPECNASFSPEAILVHKRVDISVAVAIPEGLVTPVVRNADQKSVVAIATEVRELAARARARKLRPEEMQDGTFSISNLGMFGVDDFSAVINPPEGAILAVGQVRDVPVVAEGRVVAGKRLAMTLSCDHRVVDGAVGAAFLAELRRLIEHPLRVLAG